MENMTQHAQEPRRCLILLTLILVAIAAAVFAEFSGDDPTLESRGVAETQAPRGPRTALSLLDIPEEAYGYWTERLRSSSTDELETVHWEIFRDVTLGFELSYPREWNLDVRTTQSGGTAIYFREDVVALDGDSRSRNPLLLTVAAAPMVDEIGDGRHVDDLLAMPGIDAVLQSGNTLRLTFGHQGYLFHFSSTFYTEPDRDGDTIIAIIKSLHFY